MSTYLADALFTFRLQTGDWPDCDADLAAAYGALQQALMREGYAFTYADPAWGDVAAQVTQVTAPVPCGEMEPTCEVAGLVAWQAASAPMPGVGWQLGGMLAAWLTGVPVVTDKLTWMVDAVSLRVRETDGNPPGQLWPQA